MEESTIVDTECGDAHTSPGTSPGLREDTDSNLGSPQQECLSDGDEAPLTPPVGPKGPTTPPAERKTPPADRKRRAKRGRGQTTPTVGSFESLKAKYAHLIPGRPLNAYFLFLKDPDQRRRAEEEVKAEGKEPSVTVVGSKLGQIWQNLDPEAKAVFTAQVAATAAEHAEKVAKWKASPEFAELEMAKRMDRKRKKSTIADSPETAGTPTKAAGESSPSSPSEPTTSPTKQPRKKPVRKITTLDVDPSALNEARELALEAQLIALASAAEVQALGISVSTEKGAKVLLDALKCLGPNKGSVEAARDAILAAKSS